MSGHAVVICGIIVPNGFMQVATLWDNWATVENGICELGMYMTKFLKNYRGVTSKMCGVLVGLEIV